MNHSGLSPKMEPQIERDFDQFRTRSYNENNQMVKDRFTKHPGATSFCHYVIKESRIFRKCYGEHVGFHIFSIRVKL